MFSVAAQSAETFLIDGGSTCHVLGCSSDAATAALFNMRSVNITIVVGGHAG